MREILFKAKAINRNERYIRAKYKNGDWVEGLVSRAYNERYPLVPMEMRNEHAIYGIEVDYRTLCQFTGSVDKNGRKIFEGDILKNTFEEDEGAVEMLQCVWDADECRFVLIESKMKERITLCYREDWGEVVGNIHDNPELWEV